MRQTAVRLAASKAMLLVAGGFSAGSAHKPLLTLPGLWTDVRSYSFDGPASSGVSASNWTYDDGQGKSGNDEVQANTSSTANVHLSGSGALDITARGSVTIDRRDASDQQITWSPAVTE